MIFSMVSVRWFCLLAAVWRVSATVAAGLLRGPYLQLATHDGVIVRWRTDVAEAGVVYYGRSPNELTKKAQHSGKLTEHVVRISDLKPEHKYFYAIGSATNRIRAGGTPDYFFVASPRPGTVQPVRFWAVGDPGTATDAQRRVRDGAMRFMGDRPPNLWLMLGDNAYPAGRDREYQRGVFEIYGSLLRQCVVWPTIGNHDALHANSDTQSGPYYEIFSMPTMGQAGGVASGTEAYYSFDHANVHFVCLDSEGSERGTNGAMARWLRADLAATRRDWIVAYFHHPPYTKGSHDSDNKGDSGGRLVEMRERFIPILEKGGVDLVLTGHSHAYERSFFIDGHHGYSTNFSGTMIVQDGDGRADGNGAYRKPGGISAHKGAVHIVAGSSGQIGGGKLNHPAMFVSLNKLGSLVVDVNADQMDVKFIGDFGEVRDYFTLQKK